MMNEELINSNDAIKFACESLKEAMGKATSMEGIILMDLIKRSVEIQQNIDLLIMSIESDSKSIDPYHYCLEMSCPLCGGKVFDYPGPVENNEPGYQHNREQRCQKCGWKQYSMKPIGANRE